MSEQPDQVAGDQWKTQLNNAACRFALALQKLDAMAPGSEHPSLEQATNMLMTELWDLLQPDGDQDRVRRCRS
jgi:hypothetical protein